MAAVMPISAQPLYRQAKSECVLQYTNALHFLWVRQRYRITDVFLYICTYTDFRTTIKYVTEIEKKMLCLHLKFKILNKYLKIVKLLKEIVFY